MKEVQENQRTLPHAEKVLVEPLRSEKRNTGQSHARRKLAEEKKKRGGGEKGGRESILKFSSWQALIFHHSN